MVYLVDDEEEEFSDKHKISLFDDSKFEDVTIGNIKSTIGGQHTVNADSLDQSNLLMLNKNKINVPSETSSSEEEEDTSSEEED